MHNIPHATHVTLNTSRDTPRTARRTPHFARRAPHAFLAVVVQHHHVPLPSRPRHVIRQRRSAITHQRRPHRAHRRRIVRRHHHHNAPPPPRPRRPATRPRRAPVTSASLCPAGAGVGEGGHEEAQARDQPSLSHQGRHCGRYTRQLGRAGAEGSFGCLCRGR